jgi:hypothetical protein
MKSVLFLLSVALLSSCHMSMNKKVEGNAHLKKQTRNVRGFTGISVAGPFKVTVQQGDDYAVSVEADENLLPYIEIEDDGNVLRIRERKGYNLRGTKGLNVTVQMPEINLLSLAGSGSIEAPSIIKNSDAIRVDLAGSGYISAIVETPEVRVDIAGSGNAALAGQTRDIDISIGGSGDCVAEQLKSENCHVSVGGSGTVKVYASNSLDASIGGSGNVYYAGAPPNIKKSIGGSGKVKSVSEL